MESLFTGSILYSFNECIHRFLSLFVSLVIDSTLEVDLRKSGSHLADGSDGSGIGEIKVFDSIRVLSDALDKIFNT